MLKSALGTVSFSNFRRLQKAGVGFVGGIQPVPITAIGQDCNLKIRMGMHLEMPI